METIYGGLTTGTKWRFLTLAGATVTLDMTEYPVSQVDKLLGMPTHIVGPVPEPVAA